MSIFKKFLKEMAEDAEKEIHNFLDKLEAETNSQPSPSTDTQPNNDSHFQDSYSNQSHDHEETPVRDKPGSKCSACGQYTMYHAGTDFLHGNPMTGASDCEVTHVYKCDNCGHQYEEHC